MKIKVVKTEYKIKLDGVRLRIAVAADLHNSDWNDIIDLIEESRPDIILNPGDMFGSLAGISLPEGELTGRYIAESAGNETGFAFLRALRKIAPVYCSVGNHEVSVSEENAKKIASTGAVLLDNSYTTLPSGVILGGLTTGGAHGLLHKSLEPNAGWIKRFASLKGPKILLCHHPEYWERYIVGNNIDLTISGHAHGGQWRFFGRGVLAPGQGFFPKYTSGLHEKSNEKLIISRGLRKECGVPRINNPPEVVIINIE
jgi:predicted MPP superfamily phosphohydrolase